MIGWSLDEALFRRLVGLYALSIALALAAVVYETLSPGWTAFSDGYDGLVEQHFGEVSDTALGVLGLTYLASLLWHCVALVGLTRFKRWARWSFWASMLVGIMVGFIPGLSMPSYLGMLGTLTTDIGTGLFGAILLLCYSRDHGGEWFKAPLEMLKETF